MENIEIFTLHALLDNEIKADKGNIFTSAIQLMNYYVSNFFRLKDKLYRGLNFNLKLYDTITPTNNIYIDDYIIYPIGITEHAICIILDNINKLLIIVNTGYQINKFHKKIDNDIYYPFLIFGNKCYNTFKINIDIIKINSIDNLSYTKNIIIKNINDLYRYLDYINNNDIFDIKEINNIFNIGDYIYKYDNTNDELLTKFNLNSINQVSGSCTFYSLYMSIYYILYLIDRDYDNLIISFKKYIIDSELMLINRLIVNENNIEYLKIINRKYDNIFIDKIIKYYKDIEKIESTNIFNRELENIKNNNKILNIKEELYNIGYIINEILINYQKPIVNNNLFDLLYLLNIMINNRNFKLINMNNILIELKFEDILNNSTNQINNYNNPLLFIYYIYYILCTKNNYYVIIYLIKYLENENINYKLDKNNFKLSIIYIYNILFKLQFMTKNFNYLIYNIKSYLLLFLLNIINSNNIFNISTEESEINSSYEIIINNYNIKKQLSILLNKYKFFMPNSENYMSFIKNNINIEYRDIIYQLFNILSFIFNVQIRNLYKCYNIFYYINCPYIILRKINNCSKYLLIKEEGDYKSYNYYKNTILEYNSVREFIINKSIKYTCLSLFKDLLIDEIRGYNTNQIYEIYILDYLTPNIYNFPKLLKKQFDTQKLDINIKIDYNENLLLPLKLKTENANIFLDYNQLLYSHYIDENNNYYEYEKKDFIDSFLILDDNILENINYISLLMNVYMQCYSYNYIDNDKFLKLKNFLINNIELLKTINKNYIYYFNEYYNIDIKTIIDESNDSYIIFKCNDILKFYTNISISDMDILNISINDDKYIYKDIYYKNLDDNTFIEINNIKLFIFTNTKTQEKIAIHPDFPDLYINNDIYYINYEDKKYELNIDNIYQFCIFKKIYKFKLNDIFYTNYINNNKKIEFYIDFDNDIINYKYKIILSLDKIDKTIKYFIYKKDDNILLVQDKITNDYYIIISNDFLNKIKKDNNFNNFMVLTKIIINIKNIKYLFVKLIKINDIYIPEITDYTSAIFVLLICNFYMDYTTFNFIYNKCKIYINVSDFNDLICGPFTNFYKNYNKKYIQENIEKYYNDYKFSDTLTYIEKIFYYPSVSINYSKIELQKQFIKKIKDINNINSDSSNIFKQLSDSITQENIINDMKDKDSNNKVYELLMGSGKSKFIIPYYLYFTKYIDAILNESIDLEYFYKDNMFKISYDEYMIITPSHLVNSMFDILSEFIYLLPKNIMFKKILFNNNKLIESEYIFIKNQIIIIDDTAIKYNLLINSNQIIKKNRLLLIDEIDDLINPLKSEFNLLINYDNKLPQKEILLEFIYDIILKSYIKDCNIKQYIFNLKLDNITDFMKCYFKSNDDNKDCDNKNVKNQVFYLIKKILDTIKQTDELILNKHYGLSNDNKEESYYFAQPYAGLNLPIKNSYF